ncbi:MAG: hypothetical protein K1000chlam4_01041 [Chlamydiae bacterium]|nr:hypothetical protein [Chlamydiota bacterium]
MTSRAEEAKTVYSKSLFFWTDSLWKRPSSLQFYQDHPKLSKMASVPFRGVVNGVSLALYPLSQAIGLVVFPILNRITKDKAYLKLGVLNSLVGLGMYVAVVGIVGLAIMWGRSSLSPVAFIIPAATFSGFAGIGGAFLGVTEQKKLVESTIKTSFRREDDVEMDSESE